MMWKPIITFFFVCFIVLISLDAIADNKPTGLQDFEIRVGVEGRNELASQEKTEVKSQVCDEKKKTINSESKNITQKAIVKTKATDYSNLSFNFIYYILYKFKYIDSFGLSAPEKLTPQKEDKVIWH